MSTVEISSGKIAPYTASNALDKDSKELAANIDKIYGTKLQLSEAALKLIAAKTDLRALFNPNGPTAKDGIPFNKLVEILSVLNISVYKTSTNDVLLVTNAQASSLDPVYTKIPAEASGGLTPKAQKSEEPPHASLVSSNGGQMSSNDMEQALKSMLHINVSLVKPEDFNGKTIKFSDLKFNGEQKATEAFFNFIDRNEDGVVNIDEIISAKTELERSAANGWDIPQIVSSQHFKRVLMSNISEEFNSKFSEELGTPTPAGSAANYDVFTNTIVTKSNGTIDSKYIDDQKNAIMKSLEANIKEDGEALNNPALSPELQQFYKQNKEWAEARLQEFKDPALVKWSNEAKGMLLTRLHNNLSHDTDKAKADKYGASDLGKFFSEKAFWKEASSVGAGDMPVANEAKSETGKPVKPPESKPVANPPNPAPDDTQPLVSPKPEEDKAAVKPPKVKEHHRGKPTPTETHQTSAIKADKPTTQAVITPPKADVSLTDQQQFDKALDEKKYDKALVIADKLIVSVEKPEDKADLVIKIVQTINQLLSHKDSVTAEKFSKLLDNPNFAEVKLKNSGGKDLSMTDIKKLMRSEFDNAKRFASLDKTLNISLTKQADRTYLLNFNIEAVKKLLATGETIGLVGDKKSCLITAGSVKLNEAELADLSSNKQLIFIIAKNHAPVFDKPVPVIEANSGNKPAETVTPDPVKMPAAVKLEASFSPEKKELTIQHVTEKSIKEGDTVVVTLANGKTCEFPVKKIEVEKDELKLILSSRGSLPADVVSVSKK